MKYSLSNPLHRGQLRTRFEALMRRRDGIVELSEVRPRRTDGQNRYLHTLIAYFALQAGERAEDVKRECYKLAANRDLFAYTAESRVTGKPVERLRSSASLTTEEMTLSIERFRNWAAAEAGIYLPSPDDHRAVQEMELEAERARQWL